MKRTILYIMLISSIVTTGCNKWLDVKPQGQVTKEDLFKSEKGFRDALTGAYIRLNSTNTYGSNLTWGAIEYMACNWDIASGNANTTIPQLKNANYTNDGVRSIMDDIYQGLYKAVADVNSILENVDSRQSVFQAGSYNLIKGEALAIRAFCHFDVLRLFGPMPNNPGSEKILPYVQTVTTNIHPGLSYQEYTQQLLADLDNAEKLLKEADPITKYSVLQLNSTADPRVVEDSYWAYRQIHFNYYAVLGLKARVHMWLASGGDAISRQNAARYAQMVIDGKDQTGASTFRLGTFSEISAGDYTMSPEHLMALSVYNLTTIANNNFGESGNLMRYDFQSPSSYYYLSNLFPVSERTSDIRFGNMWQYKSLQNSTDYVRYNKYIQRQVNPILQVPLLRLSEMYLILTECADSKEAAETNYKAYCSKKGIPFTSFSGSDWQSDRRNKMIREYVREFFAEGQSFFTYKRMNVTTLPASWTSTYFTGNAAKYVAPKPLREINYKNN